MARRSRGSRTIAVHHSFGHEGLGEGAQHAEFEQLASAARGVFARAAAAASATTCGGGVQQQQLEGEGQGSDGAEGERAAGEVAVGGGLEHLVYEDGVGLSRGSR